jgi:hypothetical protein
MYEPIERFRKAYQEELLRKACSEDPRKASDTSRRLFIFRLFARIISHKEKVPALQLDSQAARSLVRPSQVTYTRS